MMKQDSWCKDCNKESYWSFPYAMQIALRIKKRKKIDIRTYRCPRNRGWHLTGTQAWKEGRDGV